MDDAGNRAAVERLATEACRIYDAIPEIRRRGDDDDGPTADDFQWEDACDRLNCDLDDLDVIVTPEQRCEIEARLGEGLKDAKAEARAAAFGQLDAIEELMAGRGARFARPYEHHNEDEARIEYAERDREDY